MSDFVSWSQRLATDKYLTLFYENYMRIKLYGPTKKDFEFVQLLNSIPATVSCVPFKSRNSQHYFDQCPNEKVLIADLGVCETAATEYIECAELCATSDYYMTFCQRKNGIYLPDESFDQIQRRAYRAGVSKIPFETKRSETYSRDISFLLAPIALYC